jgi:hypothetical protein
LPTPRAGRGGDDDSAPARVVNGPDYKAAMDAVRTSSWNQVIKKMKLYVARNPEGRSLE